MTDENTRENQIRRDYEATGIFLGYDGGEVWRPFHGRHNQHSAATQRIVEPELSDCFNLDHELRRFEFKRQLEKIQFQVREEFKSEAAKLALELQRSKPLADALSQPGPCDGTMHTKIMPYRM